MKSSPEREREMPEDPQILWLFDVDGTLLTTGGAARQAFARAVRRTFGVEDDLSSISFAGRTDPLILADVLAKHGLSLDEHELEQFWLAVLDEMGETLRANHGHLLPGVLALLDRLEHEPSFVLGLLTGNSTRMADVKLGHFGVRHRFRFGAFGDEAPDRNALARVAIERAEQRFGLDAARCVVVGDTVHDVACARAAGAWAIAVATGVQSHAELAASAPDLLLDGLTDAQPLLELAAQAREGARPSS